MAAASPRERVPEVRLAARTVVAVSGGADSMVMASLILERAPEHLAAIATFDHGTGSAAREAADRVVVWAEERGIPVRRGRGEGLARTEAAWRRARWAFLTEVGREFGAAVSTAHTEDDQAETVFMRLLRQSGVRGLAGLLAPGPVLRPLLGSSRQDVRSYAEAAGVAFVEDPSNADLRYLRNRVRLELLPTLEREEPGFRAWLLQLGERAAAWRRDVAEAADRYWAPVVQDGGVSAWVPRDRRRLPSVEEAGLFWPEVAGRVGVALDWRGTARLASFTTRQGTGLRVPLSGGVVVTSRRDGWLFERAGASGT